MNGYSITIELNSNLGDCFQYFEGDNYDEWVDDFIDKLYKQVNDVLIKYKNRIILCVHACCMLSHFSRVQLIATLWTVCSLSGSSVHGDSPARILEWVAMPSSRGSS